MISLSSEMRRTSEDIAPELASVQLAMMPLSSMVRLRDRGQSCCASASLRRSFVVRLCRPVVPSWNLPRPRYCVACASSPLSFSVVTCLLCSTFDLFSPLHLSLFRIVRCSSTSHYVRAVGINWSRRVGSARCVATSRGFKQTLSEP